MAILYPAVGQRHDQVLDGNADEAVEAYKIVAYSNDGDDAVELPQSAGDPVAGVTIHDAALGERVSFVRTGIAWVELGATLTAGTKVMGATDGQAVAATTTLHVAGVLLTGGDAGDLAAVELTGANEALT